jgi:hypothetical protein
MQAEKSDSRAGTVQVFANVISRDGARLMAPNGMPRSILVAVIAVHDVSFGDSDGVADVYATAYLDGELLSAADVTSVVGPDGVGNYGYASYCRALAKIASAPGSVAVAYSDCPFYSVLENQ